MALAGGRRDIQSYTGKITCCVSNQVGALIQVGGRLTPVFGKAFLGCVITLGAGYPYVAEGGVSGEEYVVRRARLFPVISPAGVSAIGGSTGLIEGDHLWIYVAEPINRTLVLHADATAVFGDQWLACIPEPVTIFVPELEDGNRGRDDGSNDLEVIGLDGVVGRSEAWVGPEPLELTSHF